MNITTEINDIIEAIKTTNPIIVGIDGTDGVGKTSLAKDIEKLGYKRISLDDFLLKKSGGYYKFIDFKAIGKVIKAFSNNKIVIEGVLLQKILEKVPLTVNYTVYITDCVWIYDWLEEYQGKYYGLTLKEIITIVEQEVEHINRVLNPGTKHYKMDGLRKEVYEYSYEYKPWDNAHAILCKN